MKRIILVTVLALAAAASRAQTNLPYTLASIRIAEAYTGADCGAKINAADANLGSAPGEIWVSQACGTTWSTEVSLQANHTLRFVQGGIYKTSAPLVIGQQSSIVCGAPASEGGSNCTLQAANGIATDFITLGTQSTIRDMTIDGNESGGGMSGASNCLIKESNSSTPVSYGRITIDHTSITGSSGNGLCVISQTVPRIESSIVSFNSADGIYCESSADFFVSDTEIEQNGLNGLELNNCPAARINHSDFGMNGATASGCASSTPPAGYYGQLYIHGTTNAWNTAGYQIITANQFGNGCGTHIYIAGGSQNPTTANTISGNQFEGMRNSPLLATPQPQVYIVNGYKNQIVGNFFSNGNGGVSYGIQFHAAATGVSAPSVITGNAFDNHFVSYTDGNEDTTNIYSANVIGSTP